MECPRCSRKMKRIRTIDKGCTVYRYNKCLKCGERKKTVELDYIEYHRDRAAMALRISSAEHTARTCSESMSSIRSAFSALQCAVGAQTDLPGDQDRPQAHPRRRSGFLALHAIK